jgi:hypothetical protein
MVKKTVKEILSACGIPDGELRRSFVTGATRKSHHHLKSIFPLPPTDVLAFS